MENILWGIGHDLKLKNITHAGGCYIYDADGKSYLDMESGVWCTPLGHCRPEISQALINQIKDIMHTGYCYAHPVIQEAAQSILELIDFQDGKCLFLTSGSEAVEVGVKAIKKEGLLEKCVLSSSYLMEKLTELRNKYALIKEIRGRGLIIEKGMTDDFVKALDTILSEV
nr:aminotransferase class III-fold pyridoxal phosphate-dependent enzyme [Desulfobacula sp.]